MKLDTGQKITNLKGEQYKTAESQPVFLGDVIAEALATDQSGGKMKAYSLATKATANKEMEVDMADLTIIKQAVETCKTYNNIILGQSLEMLEKVK